MKVIRIFITIVLAPLLLPYYALVMMRRFFYRIHLIKDNSFHVPIVSIGNLSLGGTGKTPLTILVAKHFEKQKKKTMILSRGYKSKLESKGGLVDKPLPKMFGDEAVLMAKNLKNTKIVIGKNRTQNLKAFYNKIKPDVVILEDGYQHLKIKRNLNILIFDSLSIDKMDLSPFPLGTLREPLKAMEDADLVVLSKTFRAHKDKLQIFKDYLKSDLNVPIVEMNYFATSFINLKTGKEKSSEDFKDEGIFAFCAIGAPNSFLLSFENLNLNVREKKFYRDHYSYKHKDINHLLSKAKEFNLTLVTTEKDAVKIKELGLDEDIWFLKMEAKLTEGEKVFKETLNSISN